MTNLLRRLFALKFDTPVFKRLYDNDSASINWDCQGCNVYTNGDAIEIRNRYADPTLYNFSIQTDLLKHQHVRQE